MSFNVFTAGAIINVTLAIVALTFDIVALPVAIAFLFCVIFALVLFPGPLIRYAQRRPYYNLTGYMNRWWLFGSRRTTDQQEPGDWPICARVHQILRSDSGRDPHDHPWWNISIVLSGAYIEHTPDRPEGVWRYAGDVVFRRATDLHHITLPFSFKDGVWTLFIMGPKSRSWGFQTKNGWINWRDYKGKDGGAK